MKMLPPSLVELFKKNSEHQILKALEGLIAWAFQYRVSDIHIEPQQSLLRIRIRLDGLMASVMTLSLRYEALILSKLKMMAHLDISERRLPQDGRFEMSIQGETLSARINTCPTVCGEKAVIRLLSLSSQCIDYQKLGMTLLQLDAVRETLNAPQGLVIVTGPTGSGKTMTLYSLLAELNHEVCNIISIEDPVEMIVSGINQIQIQEKVGIAFQMILRSLLRQDPDILMIGEIRDSETAEFAIKAAQTGHLVLSTLHTESARQALSRLEGLGIPNYLVKESVRLIVGQRLVRCYCLLCRGVGCDHCVSGFRGRTGLFEVLLPNQENYVESLDLKAAGQLKIDAGITSQTEVSRVV